MQSRNTNRARRALTWASLAMTSCITAPDRDLSLSAMDDAEPRHADAAAGGNAGPDGARGGAGGEGGGGTGGAGGRGMSDAGPVTVDAAVITPDGFVAPTDAVVSRPDAFVAAADAAGSTPDAFAGPPPVPDAAVVLPPTPDALVAPPTPDVFVSPSMPDALVGPPTPDASMPPPTPDGAIAPEHDADGPDAAVPDAVVPDAQLVDALAPDAAPTCGSIGCLTVSTGEVNLRTTVARILGHLARCGPRDQPLGDVAIRMDDAEFTVPADAFRRVGNDWVGCIGNSCEVTVGVPMARAVFHAISGMQTSSLELNGVATRETRPEDDVVSTVSLAHSAIALAAAVNDSSQLTGVRAVPGTTVLHMPAPLTSGHVGDRNTFLINGIEFSGFDIEPLDPMGRVVTTINARSAETGVQASVSPDGYLTLSAADGRNILIDGPTQEVRTMLGFYLGSSNQAGAFAPLVLYSTREFTVVDRATGLIGLASVEVVHENHYVPRLVRGGNWLWGTDWHINGSPIPVPAEVQDLVSVYFPENSAISASGALNSSSATHEVHAEATVALLPLGLDNAATPASLEPGSLVLNGVPIGPVDIGAGDADGALALAVAAVSNASGVVLERRGDTLFLRGLDGRNLQVDLRSPVFSVAEVWRDWRGAATYVSTAGLSLTSQASFEFAVDYGLFAGRSLDARTALPIPEITLTVDSATGAYALNVQDADISRITPADGVDFELTWNGQTQTGFIPTQVAGPGRYTGTWLVCE